MQNDPAKPGYTTEGSTNKPVDHDQDQFVQDTGAALGYGEEVQEDEIVEGEGEDLSEA